MINKLVDKIKKTNAPVVVGLDPMMSYIPEHITKKAFDFVSKLCLSRSLSSGVRPASS